LNGYFINFRGNKNGDYKMEMESTGIKKDALRLIDALTDDATWDDLMYKIYVRQSIEAGLKDSNAGRTMAVKEVRAKFGLKN